MNTDPGENTRPRVHIVDSGDSSGIADEIIRGLDRLGVDASVPVPPDPAQVRAVVVLLSAGALVDPMWARRVEALRAARLVPVRIGDLVDANVPEYLRELNWVLYRTEDATFIAQLFTGINTDASRFRDAQDTRALAERWESEGRSPDFLIDNLGEVQRRIRNAAETADGADPLIPAEQIVQLYGSVRERREFFRDAVSDVEEASWILKLFTFWLATFQDPIDRMFVSDATTPVAFLAASRLRAKKLGRQRVRRTSFGTLLAVVAVAAIVFAVGFVQQELHKGDNAVAFSVSDSADSSRPDLTAIKAGASLVDSGSYAGDDGRLRLAVNALSQHWPLGYLDPTKTTLQSAEFLADGSIVAEDFSGTLWKWSSPLSSPSKMRTGSSGSALVDVDPTDSMTAIVHAASITIVPSNSAPKSIGGFTGLDGVNLAPKDNRVLIRSATQVWIVSDLDSPLSRPVLLGTWDSVLASTRTSDGHAVALVENNGRLLIVHDDGTVHDAGPAPDKISSAALASNGISFALDADGSLWTSAGAVVVPTGILIPGVPLAMAMTRDGLVLISDRTRGSWVADPKLGIDLGNICAGFPSVESFSIDMRDNRVLCIAAPTMMLDALNELRPKAIETSVATPVTELTSDGEVRSLALSDGFIRLDREDGTTFAFDPASLSMVHDFKKPSSISKDDYFATGAEIGADSMPSTVALTSDGGTFAIGFTDGRLIEVDVNRSGYFATVGSWKLPDNAAVQAISWSNDNREIDATTSNGTIWIRPSCSGCWRDHTLTAHIAARVWLCYDQGDIDTLGDTAETAFRLRACSTTGSA